MIPADLPPVQETVLEALTEMVANACVAEKVDVHHLGLHHNVYKEGISFRWTGNPCRRNPRLNLSVVRETGEVHTVVVQPALSIWVKAPVAARSVTAGQLVIPTTALVEVGSFSGEFMPAGGEARVPIAEGKPLTNMNVRTPFDARTGAHVTLMVSRGPIELQVAGRLMENGRVGDLVRVENTHTHTVIRGTLVAADTVQIR